MRYCLLLLTIALFLSCKNEKTNHQDDIKTDLSTNRALVNPFIGTDGTGHTFPGPSMPFGMVQPGPDNKDYGWNHTSGYQYRDTLLLGFSQTRFSGTGINEMGDVLLLPYSKEKEALRNSYFKNTEKAEVGYYALTKKDEVKVELTCSERVAFHQYIFPSREAHVFINLQHGLRFVFDENSQKGLVLDSKVTIENDSTISGYALTDNWVKRKYFYTIQFSEPFSSIEELPKAENDKAPKYDAAFKLKDDKQLKVKIALSSVSVDGSKLNLVTEIPHWDFEAVKSHNQSTWDDYLNRIQIEAPKKQKEIFYTSLYHLFLQPSNIADVDGKYRGANDEIATAPNKAYYSTLSIWDVYRAAFPLLQIVAPERIDGIVNSMLLHHDAAGFLPIWTAWGQDNYCMIGNHAIPMILSAYNNGFTGFDAQKALQAMVETSTESHINSDWELYNQYGYYPFDKLDNESVSRTLESGFDDYAVAQMAKKLGDSTIYTTFTQRANYYKNLFDPETKLFRGKDTQGHFRTPFDPLTATSPLNNPGDYTEANAWQYFWTPAQYDVDGMIELLGGTTEFTNHLNTFFTTEALNPNKFLGQEAMIGQYAHGNEPSHHILYLYAFSHTPKKGQKYIKRVMEEFHNNTPDGMIGNDDCGQMSAWYILSTLGFYPVNSSDGTFVIGAPQVSEATIQLANGKKFSMTTENFSENNNFTDSVFMNDNLIEDHKISFDQIINGGKLEFKMTNKLD
ncbi:GH92 family glycosyl hydrolase [Winogradskyella sp.]|uniref:GH92 family glycosyl hydrolase n=1 Tax=Winogradskyella sp. TaxID=1883156 RepID=UPI0026217F24|nr:GH92 family glycosyl hydrolase [Winogradskyella sp.]